MLNPEQLGSLGPDHVLDGGAIDCGSGLVLLIRDRMLGVPAGGVLELRSVEPTVRDDLPSWCRMVGHDYLGELPGDGARQRRYFVRRGAAVAAAQEVESLRTDQQRARDYEWRLRARSSAPLVTTIYCRNFTWQLGQPASFEERDAHPSAVEAALGAVAADLVTGFSIACSRAGLDIDDIELTVRGRLHDVMVHLGIGDGDAGFAAIEVKLFASTFADEAHVREAWAATLRRSPLAATLARATEFSAKIAIV